MKGRVCTNDIDLITYLCFVFPSRSSANTGYCPVDQSSSCSRCSGAILSFWWGTPSGSENRDQWIGLEIVGSLPELSQPTTKADLVERRHQTCVFHHGCGDSFDQSISTSTILCRCNGPVSSHTLSFHERLVRWRDRFQLSARSSSLLE